MSDPTDPGTVGPDDASDLPPPVELVAELLEPPDPDILDRVAEAIHRRAVARQLADLNLVGFLKVLLEYVRLSLSLFHRDEPSPLHRDEPSPREPTDDV